MFENLTNKFEGILDTFKKAPSLNEKQVDEGLKLIRQALLEADVSIEVVKDFVTKVKPKLLNSNRRYYDQKTIDILKKIKFLLKDQGMTINGVRKILDNSNNNDTLNLDEISNNSIRTDNFKNKVLKISKIVKNLKNYK